MQEFNLLMKNTQTILALGAESAGNFSIFKDETIYFSQDFGDLLMDTNFHEYTQQLNKFLKNKKIKPDVILSDLHPLFHTTLLAQELAKKYNAEHIPIQHHLAHVFSAIGDEIITNTEKPKSYSPRSCLGIACDGTGFGFNEKIWGGEVFNMQHTKDNIRTTRIGHLENHIMIGGEMAVKEPARMLIAILAKIYPPSRVIPGLTRNLDSRKSSNDSIYKYLKKFYRKNEFEVLTNQLEQNFNCIETSSTARVLDAVSVLLGFSKNERLSKHGPVALLEQNSGKPYTLKPVVEFNGQEKMWILKTTPLFEYLIKNISKDKKRLSATAQKYIADGLLKITKFLEPKTYPLKPIYFAGGMANNKIISSILESKGVYTNKKIPRGDAGLSFGQIFSYLLSK